jgi:hypothetical protein
MTIEVVQWGSGSRSRADEAGACLRGAWGSVRAGELPPDSSPAKGPRIRFAVIGCCGATSGTSRDPWQPSRTGLLASCGNSWQRGELAFRRATSLGHIVPSRGSRSSNGRRRWCYRSARRRTWRCEGDCRV